MYTWYSPPSIRIRGALVSLGSLVSPGDTIQVRFDFGKDLCGGRGGWYVDDVQIYDCLAASDCDLNGVPDNHQVAHNGRPDVVIRHESSHGESVVSDADSQPVNVEAERFDLLAAKTIRKVRIWGGYQSPNMSPSDHFTVVFHLRDPDSGLPGETISLQTPRRTAAQRSGFSINGVPEWSIALELSEPMVLPAGSYWVEVYANTPANAASFFWSSAKYIWPIMMPSASAGQAPGVNWTTSGPFHHAIELEADSIGNDCNRNDVLDTCDIDLGFSDDTNHNAVPDECEPPQPRSPSGRARYFPVLTGPYLGQDPPGTEAELFARELIDTDLNTRDIALTPDGRTLYFSTNNHGHTYSTIYETRIVDGRWTKPRIAPFATDTSYRSGEPFVAPDGEKMYFISTRPTASGFPENDYDIWVMERDEEGWGEPSNLGAPVNTELDEFFPSVTSTGTIYFTRTIPSEGTFIFRSRLVGGQYAEPERLGDVVNSTTDQYNAFIAPDESYLIVPNGRRFDSRGGTDYYICFRSSNDTWTGPINMGSEVNSEYSREWSAYVSPDGEYLFFMSDRGPVDVGTSKIFWIEAGFLNDLRPKRD